MINRSDDRIKQTGEVFTPLELVDEILDKLPPEVWQPEKTFLDPSAGDGNFLVRVLERKLAAYKKAKLPERIEQAFTALETVYGVELMVDNVDQCRDRLLEIIRRHINNDEAYLKCLYELLDCVEYNVVCSDAFKWDFDNWKPHVN